MFLGGMWYKGDYRQKVLDSTKLTDTQLTNFYDATVDGSFGKLAANNMAIISTYLKCKSATNCTADEISLA